MEFETRASVRAREGEREEAGPLDQAREGDRRADGQQGARPVRRDEGLVVAVAELVLGRLEPLAVHRFVEPLDDAARFEPVTLVAVAVAQLLEPPLELVEPGPDEGAAVQPREADEHPGPFEDEQAAAAAGDQPAQLTATDNPVGTLAA